MAGIVPGEVVNRRQHSAYPSATKVMGHASVGKITPRSSSPRECARVVQGKTDLPFPLSRWGITGA